MLSFTKPLTRTPSTPSTTLSQRESLSTVTSSTLDPNLMTPDVDRMHDLFEECLQRFDDENDRNLLKVVFKK